MSTYRRYTIVFLLLSLIAAPLVLKPLLTASASGQDKQEVLRISDAAARQMQSLIAEKTSRTSEQNKIDSQLLYSLRMSRSEHLAEGVKSLRTGVSADLKETVQVDIRTTDSKPVIEKLNAIGAEIVNSFKTSIRGRLPIGNLEQLASMPEVTFIMPGTEAVTSAEIQPNSSLRQPTPPTTRSLIPQLKPGFPARAARVRAAITKALSPLSNRAVATSPASMFIVNTSEGDTTHRAAEARTKFGVTGAGVSIGVLSDGVNSLAALQGSGDLPAVTVLSGQAGSGDEGSAMLEIVFDLAPGAQLFFATAQGGPANFAQNIRDLRTAGCNIIVDDVFYFAESVFQDGQTGSVSSTTNGGAITQAVNDVTADGALYFSSAGNEGNLNDNRSGTWEGDFVDGGTLTALPGGTVHDFGGGNVADTINAIGMGGGNPLPANLFWADPLGGSSNDYDLFLLDATLTVVLAASTNTQNGSQDPFEQIAGASLVTGARLVIFRDSGAANRFVHLRTNRGRLSVATAASTKGHSTAASAFGVAAVDVVTAGGGSFTGGAANPVETFSSDGPRHLFFNPDSSAITPGNFSSTGGLVRQKPDVAAADGVSCAAPGFNPFFGTSAAAPHAAAVAGLLMSLKPAATPAQIRAALTSSALDIEAAGVDRDSGAGIVMAYQGLAAISSADLSIVKTDSPDPVVAGTNLTYSITVTNNGGDRAVDVVVSDSLPAGTTFVSLASPAGWTSTTPAVGANGTVTAQKQSLDNAQTAVFSLVVNVLPSTPDGAVLSNTATVTSPVTDPNSGNNSSTTTTAVVARADLAVTKTDSPEPVIAGTSLTYSIALINNGPSDAQNVSLSDALPANTRFESFNAPSGWTTVTPAVGGSGTVTATRASLAFGSPSQAFTLVVRVCPEVLCNATISNTASAASTTIDPDPSNNSPTATTSVRTQSDLSITKSAAPIAVAGCTAEFTITVTNAGPSNSAGTTVIDTLPANWTVLSITTSQGSSSGIGSGIATCNLGTLGAPNQCSGGAATSATITIVAQIPANQPPGAVTNTASVSSGNCLADSNPSDNTASVSVTVFDIFMQSFVNAGYQSLIFRSDTGDYIFCRSDGFKVCGQGRITRHGCTLSMIEGLPERDRRVVVRFDTCVRKGVATLQLNPGATVVQITDKSATDNNCDFACTACP